MARPYPPELTARRLGKSYAMRMVLDAALDRGQRVTVCGLVDGDVHYCEVIPHPTRIKSS